MSPDPIGIMKQKMTDPQQWNMYSYVRNNPLKLTDPTGKYTTSCKSSDVTKCDANTRAFEAARQRDLHSGDNKVRAAAEAYGDYGKGGGKGGKVAVNVVFQVRLDRGKTDFDRDVNTGKATGSLTVRIDTRALNSSNMGADEVVGHEGSHVKDDEKLILSNYKKGNITHREAEEHAYGTEEGVLEDYKKTDEDFTSRRAIDSYIDKDKTDYPNPDSPILEPAAIP